MNFEHAHPVALCVLSMLAWLAVSIPMLWPFTLQRFMDRSPFVLSVANLLLELAVMILPKAFRGTFEFFLGHSVYYKRFETDWQWINRWEMHVGSAFFWIMLAGATWGLFNLCRGRARISNSFALGVTLLIVYYRSHFPL